MVTLHPLSTRVRATLNATMLVHQTVGFLHALGNGSDTKKAQKSKLSGLVTNKQTSSVQASKKIVQ